MAQLRRLREMFPDELVVIGVHSAKFPSEQLTDNIRQAVMRHGIEHAVVNDAGFKTWNAYAVRAWPTLVLIDPRGRIAGEASGEILAEEFAQDIREVIEQNRDTIRREPLSLHLENETEPLLPLRFPSRVLLAGERMFIADSGHHRVVEVALDADGAGGEVLRVFGSGEEGLRDGPAAEAAFRHPHGLGLRGGPLDGTLFVADTENHAIRAVDLTTGLVRTVAGTGQKAHGRRAMGSPLETPLRSPWAVLPLEDYLFIAMAGSHQIWVLTGGGQFGPFAGNGYEALVDGPAGESSFNQPSDLAFGSTFLFVADPEASAVRAISLTEAPKTVTLIGQGLFDWGDQDGPTSSAMLQHPVGLAFSAGGLVYIADTYNNKIKVLDPAEAQIHTLIGKGKSGAQDGAFETAGLFEPEGVQVHQDRLYIADTNNHLVRVADLQSRQLRTFSLRGLDRLPAPPSQTADVATVLDEQFAAPGRVRVVLDVRLPQGFERSHEAPAVVELNHDGFSERLSFAVDEPIEWTVDLHADQDMRLALALYFCQEQEARLCMIHHTNLVIPLRVISHGSDTVMVNYAVKAAG